MYTRASWWRTTASTPPRSDTFRRRSVGHHSAGREHAASLKRVAAGTWSGKVCGQATKGTRWMPWRQEAMKDVVSCEKLRGAASRHRSEDVRMGKPGQGYTWSSSS